jgi:hypothetical protein
MYEDSQPELDEMMDVVRAVDELSDYDVEEST